MTPKVGALEGNLAKIAAAYDAAEAAGCDIVAFPELAVTGYPPEDLLLKPGFVQDNLTALAKFAVRTRPCAADVSHLAADRDLHNAPAVCAARHVRPTHRPP